MSPKGDARHGAHRRGQHADPALKKVADAVRQAPFPPTAPKDAARTATIAARLRGALLRKRGGSR